MSKNMKGLSKAFKYFSQMFEEEEEEEPEIQIGLPTDVKHVAHIGVDGPATSAPTWMDDFKSSPTSESAPAPGTGNGQDSKKSKKHVKESQSRDLPKSSRRQPSTESIGSMDSPPGSPTQKSKSNRRRQSKSKECLSPNKGGESSNNPPNIPKKTRRKKAKESKEKASKNGYRNGSDEGGGEAV